MTATDPEEELLTLAECFAWCSEHQAVVTFLDVYGKHRVKVKVGGTGMLAERYTFQECISAAKRQLQRMRPER